jgi:DNA modification methylase
MTIRILHGDVIERLRGLPDSSVHCVVTSPPYWGLRSYLPDTHAEKSKEIGCEPTLAAHLDVMVNEVFAEVRRVLRPDGTCWVNYGDCYATSPNGRRADEVKRLGTDDRTFRDKPFSTIQGVMKPKDLCMVPNRFAIAMQDAGWWVRSEIIWHKPNPMPESITDRPATAHEKVFLFSKSERYFYDAVAVRTDAAPTSKARWQQDIDNQVGSQRANGGDRADRPMKAVRGLTPRHEGHINHTRLDATDRGSANLKNVWSIATKPFKEAHFATFPPDLARPCILAGTSEKGCCPNCGAQWRRITEKSFHPHADVSADAALRTKEQLDESSRWSGSQRGSVSHATVGWEPSCPCPRQSPVPAIILDPFGGAGTTGLVCAELQRDAVLIELNEQSIAIARRRIEPMLRQGSLLTGFNSLEVA